VAAVVLRVELQTFIGLKHWVAEAAKGDEGVVLGLDQQSGNADARQKANGGLSRVVIVGGSEAERRRGDLVIDIVNGAEGRQLRGGVAAGGDHALFHPSHETPFIEAIIGHGDAPDGSGKVDGSGNGAYAREERLRVTEFAGKLEADIAAEREACEEDGEV
jgi:hypothetical protein